MPEPILSHEINDIHIFIEQYSFGALVSSDLDVTHIPFILHKHEGSKGTLYAHFNRGNAHWKHIDGEKVTVIFTGPHAYISPSWYAQGPAVPTWNYVTAQIKGTTQQLPPEDNAALVEAMVKKYEPHLLDDRTIITEAYQAKLLKAIVSVKIEISDAQLIRKLGQSRSNADQLGVMTGLENTERLEEHALKQYMTLTGIGAGTTHAD